MIDRHAEADARAPVMAGQGEFLEPELAHHIEGVLAHRAEGIGRVILASVGLRAVPVTAKVHRHDCERLRQRRSDAVPADMSERISVNEEQRRAAAGDRDIYLGAPCLDPPIAKSLHEAFVIAFQCGHLRRANGVRQFMMIGHASSPTDMVNRHSKIEYCQQFSVDFLMSSRNIASEAKKGCIF
jgi:hypothetical protein